MPKPLEKLRPVPTPRARTRSQPGFALPYVRGLATVADWRAVPELTRLSPLGMGCRLPAIQEVTLGATHRVRIGFEGQLLEELEGRVVSTHAREGEAVIEAELQFAPVSLSLGRSLLEGLRRQLVGLPQPDPLPFRGTTEVIRDRRRIRGVLQALFEHPLEAQLQAPGVQLGAGALSGLGGEAFPSLLWRAGASLPLPPFELQFTGYNSTFSARIASIMEQGERRVSPMPGLIIRRRERRHLRVPAPGGCHLTGVHPVWPELGLDCPIRNISFGGLAFSATQEDALFPGLLFPSLALQIPGLPPLHPEGSLRFMGGQSDGPGRARSTLAPCGLELHFPIAEERRAWVKLCLDLAHPNSYPAPSIAPLWQVYERSGYFRLSDQDEASFQRLRCAAQSFSHKLSRAPWLGCQVLTGTQTVPSPVGATASTGLAGCVAVASSPAPRPQAEAEATVTLVKAYSGTWIGYQLARRAKADGAAQRSRAALRETVLHGYETPMADPDFRWFVTWIQAKGRFSRLLMHNFTRRHSFDRKRAAMVHFQVFQSEALAQAGNPHPPRLRSLMNQNVSWPGTQIAPATTWEQEQLLEVLAESRGLPYREAHDLVPGRLDLAGLCATWGEARLHRARSLFVARRQGVAWAAGIFEEMEEGAHLYGLFDQVRLFELMPGGLACFSPLLAFARSFYRARGKNSFCYFCEHSDTRHAHDAGLRDLGEADLTILSAELMPEQLEHAWEITATPAGREPSTRPEYQVGTHQVLRSL